MIANAPWGTRGSRFGVTSIEPPAADPVVSRSRA
jgi:hypothetical protein